VPAKKQAKRPRKTPVSNLQGIQGLREWLFPDRAIFSQLPFHGNSKWLPLGLVWMALCWAWSDKRFVTDAFTEAATTYPSDARCATVNTYQGLMGALVTWTPPFHAVVVVAFFSSAWNRSEANFGVSMLGADCVRWLTQHGAANQVQRGRSVRQELRPRQDGQVSQEEIQGHASEEEPEENRPNPRSRKLGSRCCGTLGLRLPWCWRLGPSNSSERQHVMEMVETNTFPRDTLF